MTTQRPARTVRQHARTNGVEFTNGQFVTYGELRKFYRNQTQDFSKKSNAALAKFYAEAHGIGTVA